MTTQTVSYMLCSVAHIWHIVHCQHLQNVIVKVAIHSMLSRQGKQKCSRRKVLLPPFLLHQPAKFSLFVGCPRLQLVVHVEISLHAKAGVATGALTGPSCSPLLLIGPKFSHSGSIWQWHDDVSTLPLIYFSVPRLVQTVPLVAVSGELCCSGSTKQCVESCKDPV